MPIVNVNVITVLLFPIPLAALAVFKSDSP